MNPKEEWYCQNWVDNDVMGLARNFYGLEPGENQFNRALAMFLKPSRLKEVLIEPQGTLSKICIKMGLDMEQPEARIMSFSLSTNLGNSLVAFAR